MKSHEFAVEAFASAVDFLASARVGETSCLIADVQMPRMTGVELHSRLVQTGHAIPTILITAYSDEAIRTRALEEGVICYLAKPFEESVLLGCVHTALEDGAAPHRH